MFRDHGLPSVGKQLQTVFGSPDSVKYLNLTMKKITIEKEVHTSENICLVDDECDIHNGGRVEADESHPCAIQVMTSIMKTELQQSDMKMRQQCVNQLLTVLKQCSVWRHASWQPH
jgi:hypothetical protein